MSGRRAKALRKQATEIWQREGRPASRYAQFLAGQRRCEGWRAAYQRLKGRSCNILDHVKRGGVLHSDIQGVFAAVRLHFFKEGLRGRKLKRAVLKGFA